MYLVSRLNYLKWWIFAFHIIFFANNCVELERFDFILVGVFFWVTDRSFANNLQRRQKRFLLSQQMRYNFGQRHAVSQKYCDFFKLLEFSLKMTFVMKLRGDGSIVDSSIDPPYFSVRILNKKLPFLIFSKFKYYQSNLNWDI